MKQKSIIFVWLCLILGAVLLANKFGKHGQDEIIRVETDTIVVRDTVTIVAPQAKDSIFVERVVVKERVYSQDTTAIDSAEVEIPITQKEYADSTYTAWVSGYRPRLDSIQVYPTTNYIYKTITKREYSKRKPWSLGIGVGYGYSGKVKPYVGVGIHYKILEW